MLMVTMIIMVVMVVMCNPPPNPPHADADHPPHGDPDVDHPPHGDQDDDHPPHDADDQEGATARLLSLGARLPPNERDNQVMIQRYKDTMIQ